ncbi:MAG: cellulose biosynthesis protein BcsS [Candidatus Eisenbacteria bacterium]
MEGLVGWEGDTHQQGYGFLGLGALVPAGEQLTFPVRLTGSYLYYNYDSTGTSISVKSPGISLLAGARVLGSRGSASALVGGEARREHRESATAPTRVATPVSFVVQADGDMVLARHWRAFLLGNYAGAAKYLFGRGAVQYQVSNLDWKQPTSLFVGAELVRQGNNDSDAAQGGVFLEWNFLPQRVSVGLHGGYKESWSPGQTHRSGGYIAMSAYRHF